MKYLCVIYYLTVNTQVYSMAMSASVGILSHSLPLPLTRVNVAHHVLVKKILPVVDILLWMCITQVFI